MVLRPFRGGSRITASTAAARPGQRDELPPAGEPGADEQILLNENVLAEGHDYFAVGSAAISPDHAWLAYATDTEGDESYELRFRNLNEASLATADEVVADTGYGLAWSADSTIVFYVRFDDALRPHQLWRHELGADPADDHLIYEEADRRFSLGTGLTRDGAYVMVSLHSTNTAEWLAIPADAPLSEPRIVIPRREGHEYAIDHLAGDPGWFVVLTNEDALDFKVVAAPDQGPGADDWQELVAHRPSVRIEDVDAFTNVLVLSERTAAETLVRVLPFTPGPTPFSSDLMAGGWTVPSTESPSSTWLGANAEPDVSSLRVGRTSMVTPSSVLQISLADRTEIVLKQEPVLGDFDPSRYVTSRLWATGGRRHPDPHLTGAGRCHHLAGPDPPLRLRGLRALHRSCVFASPTFAARSRLRLRRGPRARRG